MNGVSRCRLAVEALTARIDETLETYRRLQVPFRWTITPGSTPGLADRLRERGLEERSVVGLHGEVSAQGTTRPQVSAHAIGAAELPEFTRVMAEGWSTEPAPLAAYNERLLAHADRQRLFLALVDDEPAGTAGLAILQRSVYLIGAVVLPRFRGRGVYRALVEARLQVARELGRALVTCQAHPDTSAPILKALGFSTIGTFPTFHWRPG
ncbi:MAG: GNAT family N-acetyltransferase [Myxococcaceae bacterium]|nr:GNAT family N-acetyltransferase [Myxococcaceae bacterium]